MAAKRNKTNSIDITRIYDAPVKLVWEAWTDPKKAAKWWGPRGFTITTHSKDLRVGGHWAYTMHGPDGVNYENKTIYHEVEEYKKLVYDHGGNDDRPPLFKVIVKFTDLKGKTKMEMSMILETVEAAEQTRKFVKAAGGNGTWDRLAEYLESNSSGKEKFVHNRSFYAPISTMFDMWTNPEHLGRWLAPTGFTMKFYRSEIKVGATTFYSMTNGSDVTMYGRAHYLEINKPNRLVYTQQFCDEKENISRHPHAQLWPETMLTTVELAKEGPDETRVTITWECHGNTTQEELHAFVNARAGMTMGWTGALDKLEDILEKI